MDPAEYENLRNVTLLFFVEKLLDKETRTLHDLSCQFGSKGFSKEMRQIAGGSQNGLKKFLSQYPSLFTVNGDTVQYTCTSNVPRQEQNNNDVSRRDYAKESVEYFRQRLMQYGMGVHVPIKSLLGHRSQASPEVRHVSGQHIREFRDFLGKFQDVFVINEEEDTVHLKEFENVIGAEFHELPKQSSKDSENALRLLKFFGQCITERGPMLIDQLFRCFLELGACDNFQDVHMSFKTPNDLATFFKINPHCFQVHSNLVTLSDSYDVGLEFLQRQVSSSPQPQKTKDLLNSNIIELGKHSDPPKSLTLRQRSTESEQNVPKTPVESSPEKNSFSPEKSPKEEDSPTRCQSLKRRVSSIIMKTLTDNAEKDYVATASTFRVANKTGSNLPAIMNRGDIEELKAHIVARTSIIANARKCQTIVDEILRQKQPVSVDCEGINLGQDGQLTLLQLGTMEGVVYIFDVLTVPGMISILRTMLEDKQIIKVMHDCRNDSANLHGQFGIRLCNVFDTQAAHVVIQLKDAARTESKVKNISLNNLCQFYGTINNPLKDKVKSMYKHDQKYWSRRPLNKIMISYAACDVLCLVPYIYTELNSRLLPENLPLFAELCEEQVLTHINPDDIRAKRRMRKNEADIEELKSKLEQFKNCGNSTLVLSNREMRLLKHVELTEEQKEKLKGSLKVAKKLEKMSRPPLSSLPLDHLTDSSSEGHPDSGLTSLESFTTPETSKQLEKLDSIEAMINSFIRDDHSTSNNSCFLVDASTQTVSTGEIKSLNQPYLN